MPMKRAAGDRRRGSLDLLKVAHRWGVPRRQVRRLLQHGELPFEQVNGQLRVPLSDIKDFESRRDREVHR